MYEAHDDPYCYPRTSVLRNKLDIRTQAELDAFEALITHQRADELFPQGNLDYAHYLAMHHHLFQDVYDWAGKIRTVRVAKDGSMFCYPEHIDREMHRVFDRLAEQNCLNGLGAEAFAASAAHLISELNAIHPFREGNGRTQNSFLKILADNAGHPLEIVHLDPAAMLEAMVASFRGEERTLANLIRSLILARVSD